MPESPKCISHTQDEAGLHWVPGLAKFLRLLLYPLCHVLLAQHEAPSVLRNLRDVRPVNLDQVRSRRVHQHRPTFTAAQALASHDCQVRASQRRFGADVMQMAAQDRKLHAKAAEQS